MHAENQSNANTVMILKKQIWRHRVVAEEACLLKKMTDCFDFFEIGSLVTQAGFKLVIRLRTPGPASTVLCTGLCYPSFPPLAQETSHLFLLLLFLYNYYLMCIRVCLCVCVYHVCSWYLWKSESVLNFLEL